MVGVRPGGRDHDVAKTLGARGLGGVAQVGGQRDVTDA